MHIVEFTNGFANQLFMLCLYEKLRSTYGPDAVFAERSFFDRYPFLHGGFRLEKLYPLKFIDRLPEGYIEINEGNYFTPDPDDDRCFFYHGFWQDEKRFFPDNTDFVREILHEDWLSPENQEILSRIRSTCSVSLHVRRGDFIDHFLQGSIATRSYFFNAVNRIRELVEAPSFFVFSDDLDWCRENLDFGDSPAVFVTGNNASPELDMLMMSSCRHNIISNSSFSWWSQYLNRNPEKIVISPEYWYNPGLDIRPSVDMLNESSFLHVKNYRAVSSPVEDPFFTILVTVSSQKNGLVRCMSSLLNQPFGNIRIMVVVDHVSADGSQALAEEYAKADARVTLIRKKWYHTFRSTQMKAVKTAGGSWVLFVDSDDYLSSDALSILHRELTETPSEILRFAWCPEPVWLRGPGRPDPDGQYLWDKCWSRKAAVKILRDPEHLPVVENRAAGDSIIYHRTFGKAKPAPGAKTPTPPQVRIFRRLKDRLKRCLAPLRNLNGA